MLKIPETHALHWSYEPIIRMCNSVMLTTEEVAKHWRYHPQSVHNMRRLKCGPAYVKIGSKVLYRLSEIVRHELLGQRGPLTIERVSLALMTVPGLDPATRQKIDAHLSAVLAPPVTE